MHTSMSQKDVYFDVDDTLVMWGMGDHPEAVLFDHYGMNERLVPHKGHIQALINAKFLGHTVIVWSGNGKQWAREVVEMLGIERYVDFVHNKPDHYYDDLPPSEFMRNRIYYDFK